MKKFTMFGALFLSFTLCLSSVAFAHPGRTDAYGGHRDNSNVSGLGYYHYHCGGHPAHLHPNGVCPYSSSSYTAPKTTTSTPKTTTTAPKTTTVAPKATTTAPKTTTSAPKATASTQSKPTASAQNTAASTPSAAKEVKATVVVDRVEVAGPILQYKDMYYVPLEQLANLMPSIITYTYYPVIFSFEVKTIEQKSQFMDNYIVFMPSTTKDKYFHVYDCPVLQQQGIENSYAMDIRLVDPEYMDVLPCPMCMYKDLAIN